MRGPLAALAALLLSVIFPASAPLPMPDLSLMLAALTVLPAVGGWRRPYGCLGLPGDYADPQTGGEE